MMLFLTIEKRDTGIFSWPFSRPLSSTLYLYSVEEIADSVKYLKNWLSRICSAQQ
jgi:hypothetical protein